jgi:hypothetical protein
MPYGIACYVQGYSAISSRGEEVQKVWPFKFVFGKNLQNDSILTL